jgi:hypothetical protein
VNTPMAREPSDSTEAVRIVTTRRMEGETWRHATSGDEWLECPPS